jgi:2-keto-3-deoxy-L-rhamnonate aldolase RhmA
MSKKKTIGTFFEMGGCGAMECLTRTGLDYVIIDTEHGCFSEESVLEYIRSAEIGNLIPYVRIGDVRRPYVLRMLDIGARGLIVPNISSVGQVRELISYAKFAPIGKRGYCPNRTSGWGEDAWSKNIDQYMDECNKRSLIIPQCETQEALEHIEEIVALDGVDGIFVGPFDLSIAMGIPLQFNSPVLIAAIDRILEACNKYHKQSMIFSGTPADAQKWLEKGFDSVTCGLDTSIFINSYKRLVDACKDKNIR